MMIDLTKPWPIGLNGRNWWIFAAVVLAVLAVVSRFDAVTSQAALRWPEAVRRVFFAITDLGLAEWVLVPALVVFAVARVLALLARREEQRLAWLETAAVSGFVFAGVALPGIATNLLKRLVGRGRPELFDQLGPFSFNNIFNDYTFQSFPSGHTTTAFATAFVIGFLWPRTFPYGLAVAAAIGVSRVAVGMHYTTDVLAGIVVGVLGAYAVRNGFAARRWVFERLDGTVVRRRLTRGRDSAPDQPPDRP